MTTSLEHIKRLEDELAQLKEKVAKEEAEAPVRWRTPVAADLVRGPRPCQARDFDEGKWSDETLVSVHNPQGHFPYRTEDCHFAQCRIIDTRPLEGEVVAADDDDIGQIVCCTRNGFYALYLGKGRSLDLCGSPRRRTLRKLWPSERVGFNSMMGCENE